MNDDDDLIRRTLAQAPKPPALSPFFAARVANIAKSRPRHSRALPWVWALAALACIAVLVQLPFGLALMLPLVPVSLWAALRQP
jgi:hypothetical protein